MLVGVTVEDSELQVLEEAVEVTVGVCEALVQLLREIMFVPVELPDTVELEDTVLVAENE